MDGWMDGWVNGRAGLRIANRIKKFSRWPWANRPTSTMPIFVAIFYIIQIHDYHVFLIQNVQKNLIGPYLAGRFRRGRFVQW